MRILAFLFLSVLFIASMGCVSTGRHRQEITSLQNQVAQMDAALKAEQQKNQALQAQLEVKEQELAKKAITGVIYRTPSGFEIPAIDIQKALKGAGYYVGEVDGRIGPDSREAIRNFQRDQGLTADGVCGQQTWAKLQTYLT
ncbi:MAG: peptidoglycan-binding protein [Candidatus Omnitrophica bacterium]|nr:peptidoglycan-binding protein [Candidatus Omnitrophota bacterium]